MNIEFNNEFKQALQLMEETNRHLFVTGKAGTGKSTLLTHFSQTTKKNVVLLAPTGIAALNIKGQTIHSFFGFPPQPIGPNLIRKRKDKKLYQNLDAIIIDEVSMLRADLLDSINYFMRVNGKRRDLPFGGVQMIFIGDLFQLPPVLSTDVERQLFDFKYDTPYFFSAHALFDLELTYIALQKVYRQKDRDFLQLLDGIRTKTLTSEQLWQINKRYDSYYLPNDDEYYINLCSTNYIADHINRHRLRKLQTPVHLYQGEIEGDFKRKLLPCPAQLALKEGAQVMFVKNDPTNRWVNGTIGRIHYLDEESIGVTIDSKVGEVQHEIRKVTWEIRKYKYNEEEAKIEVDIIGSFTQYPIKLAWAVTIHKSQGLTFDRVIINLGKGAFASGQVYVALSRCRTLEGIILRQRLRRRDIIVDERIVEQIGKLHVEAEKNEKET